jgi:hypothetical protein
MTESEIIKKVLNLNYNSDNKISTLSIAIKGARELSERNINTGVKITGINIDKLNKQITNKTFESNKFVAIAMYLIIIDLIGSIFKKKGKKEQKKDRFKQALNHFVELDDEKIKSLKNLRNSLAHKFSLGNESEVFVLEYFEKSEDILVPSEEPYSSQNRNNEKSGINFTIAYYESICDLTEKIYREINELAKDDKLEIVSIYKNNNEVRIHDFNSMYFIK